MQSSPPPFTTSWQTDQKELANMHLFATRSGRVRWQFCYPFFTKDSFDMDFNRTQGIIKVTKLFKYSLSLSPWPTHPLTNCIAPFQVMYLSTVWSSTIYVSWWTWLKIMSTLQYDSFRKDKWAQHAYWNICYCCISSRMCLSGWQLFGYYNPYSYHSLICLRMFDTPKQQHEVYTVYSCCC